MLIDLTVCISAERSQKALQNEKMVSFGHLGTHFDVMNKVFPLEFTQREGLVVDVQQVRERDIEATDIDLSQVKAGQFIAFHSGFIEQEPYGTKSYFSAHPQLSDTLIDQLLECGVSIIGVDFAGVRRGSEHTPKDQYCADHGVFIVENLCNLNVLLDGNSSRTFTARTFPIHFEGMSGLPCRVVADCDE